MRVHVTAFGSFNGVPDNPSKALALALADKFGLEPVLEEDSKTGSARYRPTEAKRSGCVSLASVTVLETSAAGSLTALKALRASFADADKACGCPVLYLHLGVSSRSSVSLEVQAFNEARARMSYSRASQTLSA